MEEQKTNKNFLFQLKEAYQRMGTSFNRISPDFMPNKGVSWQERAKSRNYTQEEIKRIIESGSLDSKRNLSRQFFYSSSIYRRIIIYYATHLKYMGLVIPHQNSFKKANKEDYKVRYDKAINFMDKVEVKKVCQNFAIRTLVDGEYFGILLDANDNGVRILTLPSGYCSTKSKTIDGEPIVQFNLSFFSLFEKKQKEEILSKFPRIIQKAYNQYSNGQGSSIITLPPEIAIYFSFFDSGPLLLNTIETIVNYEDYIDIEKNRDENEIKKILVHEIDHFDDGSFLLEPEEAEEVHNGIVEMLRGNSNIDVITTYGKVVLQSAVDNRQNTVNNMEKVEKNIFTEAGTSRQLFSADGNLSMKYSLANDLSLMMSLADQFSIFFKNILNSLYSNGKIHFSYEIFPISYYNEEDFINNAFKLASFGYSSLLPALGLGVTQKNLVSLKNLENDFLEMDKILIPLSSSYTSSGNAEGGNPGLPTEKKSDKTLKNEESLEGGGS